MIALSLLLLTAAPAPLKVALPNFDVINVAPASAAFFMDRFANRLRARGLSVTSATEIETVLGLERQKTLLGCADASTTCQAEIAAALGADAIVRARIARFGQRFELSLTVIDPANAAVIGSVTSSADDESQVLTALDAGADDLSAKVLAAKRRPAVELTTGDVGRPGWVPLIPLGIGLGAGALGVVRLAESYRKVPLIATESNFQQLAEEARVDRGLGIALIGVGVAGLGTAAILFFTGKAPAVTPVALLSREGAIVGVEGRLP